MLITIILLPLLNFILIALGGSFMGYRGVMRLALMNLILSIIITMTFLFFLYSGGDTYYVNLGNWFTVGDISVDITFILDKLSLIMLATVLIVSYTVHLYSCAYMSKDPHFPSFLSYLSLFTFFM